MKHVYIVLGLHYGDEGKSKAVQHILKQFDSMLKPNQLFCVRFNGGHQAGHTGISKNGTRHVFSNFCVGTFHSASTVISRFCTFSPESMLKEYDALKTIQATEQSFEIKLYVDPRAMVCTFWDYMANQKRNSKTFMSVGTGFADTISRNEGPAKMTAADLLAPYWLLSEKFNNITNWYWDKKSNDMFDEFNKKLKTNEVKNKFLLAVKRLKSLIESGELIIGLPKIPENSITIFEGAQGIQLDMDNGVNPYITKSNTTSKNAEILIKEWGFDNVKDIYGNNLYKRQIPIKIYVTRTFLTRHGAGPFPNDPEFESEFGGKIRTLDRTNFENTNQGQLRIARLDQELINHSLLIDSVYIPDAHKLLYYTWHDLVPIPVFSQTQYLDDEGWIVEKNKRNEEIAIKHFGLKAKVI